MVKLFISGVLNMATVEGVYRRTSGIFKKSKLKILTLRYTIKINYFVKVSMYLVLKAITNVEERCGMT